jgi:hypothetical protein
MLMKLLTDGAGRAFGQSFDPGCERTQEGVNLITLFSLPLTLSKRAECLPMTSVCFAKSKKHYEPHISTTISAPRHST